MILDTINRIDPNSLKASDNAVIKTMTTKKVFDEFGTMIREELVGYSVSIKHGYSPDSQISVTYTELPHKL